MSAPKKLKVCWISAGVSSFIAGYLERDTIDKYIYIDVEDQHPDSMRFIKDCEKVLGKTVEVLKSPYGSVENAIRAAGVVRFAVTGFAPCTAYLKKRVRKEWEYEHRDYEVTYVWGMDCDEKHRADNIEETMFEFNHCFPLIERGLTKSDAHAISAQLGIRRPAMYDMGYSNNNCIGCVKGGMGYWNKIRVDFPEVFESRAKLEREVNSRSLKECFLDELEPGRGRMADEIMEDCGIFCYLALAEE
jgi:hypothetical protein